MILRKRLCKYNSAKHKCQERTEKNSETEIVLMGCESALSLRKSGKVDISMYGNLETRQFEPTNWRSAKAETIVQMRRVATLTVTLIAAALSPSGRQRVVPE
jgi:hypothetical protein